MTSLKLTDDLRSRHAKASGLVVLVDVPRKPPAPPAGVTGARAKAWKELWSSPLSAVWRPEDAPVVLRLVDVRLRLETEAAKAPAALFGICQGLEDRLCLNPRARRAAGIELVPGPPRAERSGSGKLSAAERRKLDALKRELGIATPAPRPRRKRATSPAKRRKTTPAKKAVS